MSDNPCAIWDKTKSSKTSATDLRDCPFIVIFRAIIRPHAFHRNLLLGMRSNFFMRKKKPLKTIGFQGFGGDYGTRYAFSPPSAGGENNGSRQFANWRQQQSTGLLHCYGFESLRLTKNQIPHRVVWDLIFGGDYGTRTCDLMRVKHAL